MIIQPPIRAFPPRRKERGGTLKHAGALGAYLVHHRVFGGELAVVCLEHERAYELGRPSRIVIEVARHGSTIACVRVGGCVAKVIDGTVYV